MSSRGTWSRHSTISSSSSSCLPSNHPHHVASKTKSRFGSGALYTFTFALLFTFSIGTVWMHSLMPSEKESSSSSSFTSSSQLFSVPGLTSRILSLHEHSKQLGHALEDWRHGGSETLSLPPEGFLHSLDRKEEELLGLIDASLPVSQQDVPQQVKEEERVLSKQQEVAEEEAVTAREAVAKKAVIAMKETRPKKPMLLVVGGTDGSGTRSVVDLLQTLGVKMAVDDEGTMDVHGWEMKGGWPPVVNQVLAHTHSADYEYSELSEDIRVNVRTNLDLFFRGKSIEMRNQQGKGDRAGAAVQGVSWGFKAPISMLLVPLFHQITQGIKFLHVVRDGRDISFSGNQSPVRKFYGVHYDVAEGSPTWESLPPEVKAIRLWSDWNVQISEWAERHADDGETFDYLRIRTEDLVNLDTKYDAYRKIASFVGADLTAEQVCCLVRRPAKWMGSHDSSQADARNVRGGDAAAKTVKSRYGFWREKVKDEPDLLKDLEKWGGRGLHTFGYMGEQDGHGFDIEYPESECSLDTSICTDILADSPFAAPPAKTNLRPQSPPKPRIIVSKAEVPIDDDLCQYKGNLDFRGPGIDLSFFNGETVQDCCRACYEDFGCQAFTYAPNDGVCYLKSTEGSNVQENPVLVSGVRVVPSAMKA